MAIFTRDEHEPAHVHVKHPDGFLVILLDETSRSGKLREKSRNLKSVDVRDAIRIVNENFDLLLDAWERIHRGKD